MTWRAAVAILAAGGAAGGVVLLVRLFTGHVRVGGEQGRDRLRGVFSVRLLAGVVLGLLVLVLTSWVAVAAAVALFVVLSPRLFGAAGEARGHIERLEALAEWVESLRDSLERGRGLPEVIMSTAATAPPVLSRPLGDLVARMQAREPLERALLYVADDLDDAVADQVIATLALNAQASGRKLPAVLGALATSTRRQVEVRRQVEADRASPRRNARLAVIITIVMVVGLRLLSPEFLEPLSTFAGQVALSLAVASFGAAFMLLRALGTFDAPKRFLASPGVRQRSEAAAGGGGSITRAVLGSVAVRG